MIIFLLGKLSFVVARTDRQLNSSTAHFSATVKGLQTLERFIIYCYADKHGITKTKIEDAAVDSVALAVPQVKMVGLIEGDSLIWILLQHGSAVCYTLI